MAAFVAQAVAGCDVGAQLGLPETPLPAAGDWPRLVDAPFAPAFGSPDPTAPDPAEGRRIAETLKLEAAVGAVRAEALAAPVLTPAEQARLRSSADQARLRGSADQARQRGSADQARQRAGAGG